jgi:hypothetical protein
VFSTQEEAQEYINKVIEEKYSELDVPEDE